MVDYDKVWESMNDLEMVTSKICSARAILDSAIESLESGNREKTETLMYAADEFLQYYLTEFDEKFKVAWKETVTKLKTTEDDGMRPWGHSDFEYLIANNKKDKVTKWQLPIEEVIDEDTQEMDYCITFPDDLLEAANLKEGDNVEWVDNGDGSYLLKKVKNNMTHDEMLADGWNMTDDGFWIKGEI